MEEPEPSIISKLPPSSGEEFSVKLIKEKNDSQKILKSPTSLDKKESSKILEEKNDCSNLNEGKLAEKKESPNIIKSFPPKRTGIRRLQKPKPNLPDIRRPFTLKSAGISSTLPSETQDVTSSPDKTLIEENKISNMTGKISKKVASPTKSVSTLTPVPISPSLVEKTILRERPLSTPSQLKDSSSPSQKKKPRNSHLSSNIIRGHREFINKFRSGPPDRKKLTMFDLIFYNPSNNPLSENQEPQKLTEQFLPMHEEEEELDVDDPESPSDQIPAPQVKVGPDGQIILDEQSLVIETTGAKKGRIQLANSKAIVDEGLGASNYGSYRRKVSRGWTKEETKRFYKALNTIGTDFLLMQTLFPDRTRQELKMKFKKEDKIHRSLIEKTLRNPMDFDLEELEKEAEIEKTMKEDPKKEKSKSKKRRTSNHRTAQVCEESVAKPKEKKKPPRKKTKRKQQTEIDEEDDDEDEYDPHLEYLDDLTLKNIKYNPLNNKQNEKDVESKLESNQNNALKEETNSNQVEYDEELNEIEFLSRVPQPTRAGRIPQSRITTEHIDTLRESEKAETELPIALTDNNTLSLANIPPGTMVLFSTPSQDNPNSMVYQLFMVGPNSSSNTTEVIASSDSLEISNEDVASKDPVEMSANLITYKDTLDLTNIEISSGNSSEDISSENSLRVLSEVIVPRDPMESELNKEIASKDMSSKEIIYQ